MQCTIMTIDIYGVPQGSILGPLLFNTSVNDFFLFSSTFNIANYADDCSHTNLVVL